MSNNKTIRALVNRDFDLLNLEETTRELLIDDLEDMTIKYGSSDEAFWSAIVEHAPKELDKLYRNELDKIIFVLTYKGFPVDGIKDLLLLDCPGEYQVFRNNSCL